MNEEEANLNPDPSLGYPMRAISEDRPLMRKSGANTWSPSNQRAIACSSVPTRTRLRAVCFDARHAYLQHKDTHVLRIRVLKQEEVHAQKASIK
jgi:hypothetical protein